MKTTLSKDGEIVHIDMPGYAHTILVSKNVAMYFMRLGARAQRDCVVVFSPQDISEDDVQFTDPDMLAVLKKEAGE